MKVVKGDLSSMETSASQVFDAEVADAEKVIAALDSFMGAIGPGTSLTGEAYNTIKGQLSSYKSLMEQRKALASSMKSAISSAISSMSSYMEGYSVLDTAELEDLQVKINNANTQISNLQSRLNNTELLDAEKGSISSLIGDYQAQLEELKKKQDKLKNLSSADGSAYGSLTGVITDLSAFGGTSSSV